MAEADAIRIFLSYARGDDEPFVRRLKGALADRGFDVWFDRHAMENRGRSFLQELRDAVATTQRMIAVIGPKALASPYCRV